MNVNNISLKTEQPDVISQIYKEYYSKIYKYTLFRVNDHGTAEDLVSDVFEKVLLKHYTYNPEKAKLSTWLFTIVNNTITNYFKKNIYQPEPLELEKVDSSYCLEDLVIKRELKGILLKAIMCLHEHQRNIIALKFGACLTNRQIAQMMGLSESNVGTILYRALKRLKDILKEQGAVIND